MAAPDLQEFTLWAQPGRPCSIRVCGLFGDERQVQITVNARGEVVGGVLPRVDGDDVKVERGR